MLNLTPLHITGGTPLLGELTAQPSKNAALPIIVAALLSPEPVVLHGIPRLADIYIILEIVSYLGTKHRWLGPNSVELYTPELLTIDTPYALVSKMRASFIVMGALLSRGGEAKVSMPGGCAFGHRPVDQHVKAFRAIGAEISEEGGSFHAVRRETFNGSFMFEMLTVGATQNAILAATLGRGRVTLENASIDTDVVDMVNFLNKLGAKIYGAGTNTITIEGVERLTGGEYRVIPDRIEVGSWMIAAVATRGCVTFREVNTLHLRAVTHKLQEMGARILELDGTTLQVDARNVDLKPVNVTTLEYPGFPTDIQPQMSALLATVAGTSIVVDRIYPDRLTHIAELQRMGAQIEVPEHTQIIRGTKLHAAPVRAADIRAGAALMVAAMATEGTTVIEGMQYINRGYEHIADRLAQMGANVKQPVAVLAAAD